MHPYASNKCLQARAHCKLPRCLNQKPLCSSGCKQRTSPRNRYSSWSSHIRARKLHVLTMVSAFHQTLPRTGAQPPGLGNSFSHNAVKTSLQVLRLVCIPEDVQSIASCSNASSALALLATLHPSSRLTLHPSTERMRLVKAAKLHFVASERQRRDSSSNAGVLL